MQFRKYKICYFNRICIFCTNRYQYWTSVTSNWGERQNVEFRKWITDNLKFLRLSQTAQTRIVNPTITQGSSWRIVQAYSSGANLMGRKRRCRCSVFDVIHRMYVYIFVFNRQQRNTCGSICTHTHTPTKNASSRHASVLLSARMLASPTTTAPTAVAECRKFCIANCLHNHSWRSRAQALPLILMLKVVFWLFQIGWWMVGKWWWWRLRRLSNTPTPNSEPI